MTDAGMEGPVADRTATDRRLTEASALDDLRFDEGGLIPVVAQDADDGRVLMVAWANREALALTLETGFAHFWSRSRGELWKKGETSGNVLELLSLHTDCDRDTVLARVRPAGPACHTGEATCFGAGSEPRVASSGTPGTGAPATKDAPGGGSESTLPAVFATLESRKRERPEGSWTVKLLDDENLRIKKIGEEAAELVHALSKGEKERAAEEAGDLIYHALAALLAEGITLADVLRVLESRR